MAVTRGVEPTQCLIERGDLADLGMVREQRYHVATIAEDAVHKALQGLLGAYFDENARAGVVQRLQPFDELHGRRDLPGQQVEHDRYDVVSGGIEVLQDPVALVVGPLVARREPSPEVAEGGEWSGAVVTHVRFHRDT